MSFSFLQLVRIQLTHKPVTTPLNAPNLKAAIADAIHKRYDNFNKDMVEEVQYDPDARLIVVDVKKPMGERKSDLTNMAYYMEKDVKMLPLFKNQDKFEPTVGSQKLEMENILVYYVDEKAPTFTTDRASGVFLTLRHSHSHWYLLPAASQSFRSATEKNKSETKELKTY
ncbi:epithelial cell adhesion molecule-like [Lates calcarifer]|uniref:Epithelial cell adhesion molecule-like n=1 Tax=Lates calcarifer TaxID=8187 RepID=A0AAJ7Q947_LATCA|nr:epithelial cell adhesion molecule-like [Lates calcarifer]